MELVLEEARLYHLFEIGDHGARIILSYLVRTVRRLFNSIKI